MDESVAAVRSPKVRRVVVAATTSAITLAFIAYVGSIVVRATSLYDTLAQPHRGWRGTPHRQDDALGYTPRPGTKGAHTFPIGDDVPMRFDEFGFRVPVSSTDERLARTPTIMTIGDSITYGDATPAEDTFPQLVADALGGSAMNAGVCGYGLAQMVLRAAAEIPRHRPHMVIIQYTPWLAQRSTHFFAPTYTGVVPVPYYAQLGRELTIAPPVFRAMTMRETIAGSPFGVASFISLDAIPAVLYEDVQLALFQLWDSLGTIPTPVLDVRAIEKAGYEEIARIARDTGARVVFVMFNEGAKAVAVPAHIDAPGAVWVNAQEALLSQLPTHDDQSFAAAYGHWRGDPPRLVDRHPNARAHAVIAASIVAALNP